LIGAAPLNNAVEKPVSTARLAKARAALTCVKLDPVQAR
jgi:hypothetical protein